MILNVTDGVDSNSTGVQYQCNATNSFGTIISKPVYVITTSKYGVNIISVGGYEVTFENVLRKFTHLLEFTDLRAYLLVMHVLRDSR